MRFYAARGGRGPFYGPQSQMEAKVIRVWNSMDMKRFNELPLQIQRNLLNTSGGGFKGRAQILAYTFGNGYEPTLVFRVFARCHHLDNSALRQLMWIDKHRRRFLESDNQYYDEHIRRYMPLKGL
ncbi:MAG: hypothetical protein [Circoviridae sp.]|nr:MAG: hypothetical protein [Circoviridae sp.]